MFGKKQLSRRESEIMDIIYNMGEATAMQVLENMPDPPSYSAVRALLKVLEDKGEITHKQDGPRYVFLPTTPQHEARESALKHVVRTFFDNSTEKAVAALLDISGDGISEEEYLRLSRLIERARQEGR